MNTLAMHRVHIVQELAAQLEPDTWAYNYWHSVLAELLRACDRD